MICLSNDQVDQLNDQFELRPSKDDVFNGVSFLKKFFEPSLVTQRATYLSSIIRKEFTILVFGMGLPASRLCDINRILLRVA